jgi:hypothetical protein
MSDEAKPRVLIVDDEPDEAARQIALDLNEGGEARADCLEPADVAQESIENADLVLVDHVIDHWPSREKLGEEIGLQPPDGVALAAVLRRWAHASRKPSPTAFAIFTGKMRELARPLPSENRPHILAGMTNVEWVFAKGQTELLGQIVGLAKAVRQLPRKWSDDGLQELRTLLAIPLDENDPLAEDMTDDALKCLPPVQELSDWSHGLAFLRWLLHRIMPYPCFLWDEFQLAARFRVDPRDLAEALADQGSALREALGACEYGGILAGFTGPLWWRVLVEAHLWENTNGQSFDLRRVRDLILAEAGRELSPSEPEVDPVVCYDKDLRPLLLAAIKEAVRIRPDDWPSFADQAWTTASLARQESTLGAVVIPEDRGCLDE